MIFQQFPIISVKISEGYPNVFQMFSKTGQDLQKGSEIQVHCIVSAVSSHTHDEAIVVSRAFHDDSFSVLVILVIHCNLYNKVD